MASITITNHIAKGFSNKTTGTKMTWWKTSFNMPVKNIFDNNSIYTETEGMLNAIGEDTNFSLVGFQVGWEVIAGSSVFTIHGPFAGGNVTISQTWKNTSGGTIFVNQTTVNFPSLADSTWWSSYQLVSNQGVASWEISQNGTYQLVSTASGAISGSTTTNITITNCPNTSGYYTPGMVWVEGNDLRWSSANGHLHTVYGNIVASPGASPGYIWSNTANGDIFWTGTSGNVYVCPVLFKQFESIFSNGATGATYAGPSKQGYIWMDNEFGYEHIAYISSDGYKWLFPSGENPYV